ncbi:uncharacterized protein FA14DRAFT_188600 [Meira miltonrushii]|uniref:Uncharacterized protein n=1 Tax=Meira miltonrushii TaxID=1280837 RepID=A0A316VE15_9BASI|nr:uncharacterized protein FA14DRAFT_188600 [Meira miltonrushii]PWN34513.1 hypothetical protein FA14DRAFT_188600 [Meira miltonrushii]
MVKEVSQAAKSFGSRMSKAPSGKGFSIPGRGMASKAHFANDLHTSSPKSILRPKQVSPQRSKISNRVSFHERHVVQPSSSSKHTMPPYGGTIGRVEVHEGSKSARPLNKKESFKNPWGHSSSSATSKPKNNEGSRRNRAQSQGSAFFQSMHNRQQSQRQSHVGGGPAASTAHSPASSHSPTHQSGEGSGEVEKPVKGLAKVARDYPGLGFAVTGAAMIVGTTKIVTHNMRAKEEEVMRKKKELGVPPVDLSKERKAEQKKLQKQAQASTPPPPAPKPSPPPEPVKGKP